MNSNRAAQHLVVALPLLLGCGRAPAIDEAARETPQAQAASVADRYVATRWPDYDRKKFPMAVTERGDTWVVLWKLPPTMLGGSPVVILKKSDLSIVCTYVEQ